MNTDQKLSCSRILKHFGIDAQMDKLCEELAELDEAIRSGDKDHIAEEIADVEILLEQVKEGKELRGQVRSECAGKLQRTHKRIGDGYYEKSKEEKLDHKKERWLQCTNTICNHKFKPISNIVDVVDCPRCKSPTMLMTEWQGLRNIPTPPERKWFSFINNPTNKRGSVLLEALDVINGERQDQYGNPEDSFTLIADYWSTYLQSINIDITLTARDATHMMMLFKIARMSGQKASRDNYRDVCGYAGIAADMV